VWRGKVERLRLLEASAAAAFRRASEVARETDRTRAEAEQLAADNRSQQVSLQSAQRAARKATADATASLTHAKATDKKLKKSLATVNAKRMQMSRQEPGRNGREVQGVHFTPLDLFLNPLGLFLRTSILFI
jgi:septal ring factor EnvC (AmiA/AmiB activator)